MPQIVLNNVTLAFTNCMLRPSDFGSYNYSFIINKEDFCNKVRAVLATQKTQVWDAKKNTDNFILGKCNAKSKEDVTFEPVKDMMDDNDILVQVKSKTCAISNTKNVPLGRGTTADVLIDIFEFEYGKKQFICIRSHADRGCTVKVNELKEINSGIKYFDVENDAEAGFNKEALDAVKTEDVF